MAWEEAITIGLGLLTFVLMYLANNSGGLKLKWRNIELDPLQFMFFGMGILMVLTQYGVMLEIAETSGGVVHDILSRGLYAINWGFIIIVWYFFIYIIIMIFKPFLIAKE